MEWRGERALRVLVTGGAGFIGHNLAIHLYERGFEPIVFDSLERSTEVALKRLRERGLSVVRGDVRDKYSFREQASKSDLVIHAAAYISVEESFERPGEYVSNNAGGTAVVASACLELGKPVIYISSAAVYGDPVRVPIPEDHPVSPASPYGLSKALGEAVINFYGRLGLKYVIVRPFNVYGVGQTGPYAGVVTKFVERACRGEPPVIYGDGLQVRDFIHVSDFSRFVELVVEKEPWGEVFNAGTGVPTRILDLARLVIELAGLRAEPIYEKPRPGDIRVSLADVSKARRILGFEPRVGLREGISELIEYYCGSP
ncbi:MAG: NAD-dependent epimerase/dehydratase family protein [Desulfurococcaceae archaeon]